MLLIPCCSNYCRRSCSWTSSLSPIFLSGMPMSGCRQNGSCQMFLPEVLPVLYWDKFCICMPLTFFPPSFLSLVFYVFPQHFLHKVCPSGVRNIPHTARKISIRLFQKYVLSQNASADRPDIVPLCGMSCNFSSDLRFC